MDDDDAVAASHVAVVKGAPEVIKQYLAQVRLFQGLGLSKGCCVQAVV